MPVAAGISAAAGLGSAAIGYFGAQSAADKQAQAAANALDFQKQVYAQNQNNVAPWINTGGKAAYSLADLYGLGPNGTQGINDAFDKFTQLPAYQFPLQQGMLALTRNLNAQGKNMSGAQLREAQQFGQGLASTYMMSNYVSPLQQMSQLGQGAASSLASSNNQSAQQIGNSFGNIGAAQASGIVGGTNALTGGITGAGNSLALLSYMGKNGGGTAGVSSYGGGMTGGVAASGGQFPSGGGSWFGNVFG